MEQAVYNLGSAVLSGTISVQPINDAVFDTLDISVVVGDMLFAQWF